MNFWELLLWGWALMALAMAVLWEVQRRFGKAGIVDVLWAGGVGALALFFVWQADGYVQRRFLIGILAGAWSFRLTSYLLVRVVRMTEDGRYEEMKQKWGKATQRNLFLFFQVQAFWSVLFAAPMLLAAQNSEAPLGWVDAAGVAVWILAIYGEAVADRQLARFRMRPGNKGKVCQEGLWRYSRHPNYFFEWSHWWAYVLIGWNGPMGYLTLLGPAAMLLFLFKITGIPPTEANALKSRGNAYREYQRTTSAFFPWRPKKGNAAA